MNAEIESVSVRESNQNALLLAGSLIAALRTAHEDRIDPTSWPMKGGLDTSVRLAEMVWNRIEREAHTH